MTTRAHKTDALVSVGKPDRRCVGKICETESSLITPVNSRFSGSGSASEVTDPLQEILRYRTIHKNYFAENGKDTSTVR